MTTIPVFNIEIVDKDNAQHFIKGTSIQLLDDATCIIFFGDSVEAIFKQPNMVKKHQCPDTIEI